MFDDIMLYVNLINSGSIEEFVLCYKSSIPKINRKMLNLETKLGVKLFADVATLTLTCHGKILYERFSSHQEKVEKLLNSIYVNEPNDSSALKVALALTFGENLVIPYLDRFIREVPNVNLDIKCKYAEVDMIKDDYDIALVGFMPKQQSQRVKHVFRAKNIICCTPAYIQKYGLLSSVDDLPKHKAVTSIFQDNSICQAAYIFKEDNDEVVKKITVPTNIATNDFGFGKLMIDSGEVIGAYNEAYIRDELASGKLIRLLPEYHLGYLDIFLLRNIEEKDHRYQKFLAFLNSSLESLRL